MMAEDKSLFLYEEVMLLALRDKEGTIATGFAEYVVAGAILAELLLDSRISVEDSKKQLVDIQNDAPSGDPVIDECLRKIAAGKRLEGLQTWISRLAGTKNLKHKVARQLCDRGILRADEDKVLFIFTRQVYPEIDPIPEKQIVERLRTAIFTDRDQVDPRTVVLISLANGADLLNQTFGSRDIRNRKKRIEQIVNGELTGKATKDLIAACQAAMMVAAIMPIMITTTINN